MLVMVIVVISVMVLVMVVVLLNDSCTDKLLKNIAKEVIIALRINVMQKVGSVVVVVIRSNCETPFNFNYTRNIKANMNCKAYFFLIEVNIIKVIVFCTKLLFG